MSDTRAVLSDDNNHLFLSRDKAQLLTKLLEKYLIEPIKILNDGRFPTPPKVSIASTKVDMICSITWPRGLLGLNKLNGACVVASLPEPLRAFLSVNHASGILTIVSCKKAVPLDLLKDILYPGTKERRQLALYASTMGQVTRPLNRDFNLSCVFTLLPTELLYHIVALTMAPFSVFNYENALAITIEKFEKTFSSRHLQASITSHAGSPR